MDLGWSAQRSQRSNWFFLPVLKVSERNNLLQAAIISTLYKENQWPIYCGLISTWSLSVNNTWCLYQADFFSVSDSDNLQIYFMRGRHCPQADKEFWRWYQQGYCCPFWPDLPLHGYCFQGFLKSSKLRSRCPARETAGRTPHESFFWVHEEFD